MKTKWPVIVLSFSLIATACSRTENSSTLPTQPQVQPPITSPQPAIQPPKPSPQPPTSVVSPPPTSPEPVPITGEKTAEVQVTDLNVRSSPDTTSQVRGRLPKGTQAKILKQQGNWYYIVTGPVEGWVSGSYIKVLDGNPGSAISNPKPITGEKTAEVQVTDLNVRSSPDTTSQVRGRLPKGTQAKILKQQGNWYYIVTGPVEGWVSGSYIKVLDGNPGNTTSN